MNTKDWLDEATSQLSREGIDSARLDAVLLLEKVLKIDRTKIIADPMRPLTENDVEKLKSLLKKRLDHVPIAYLLGTKEFYGRIFKLNRSVLIPRPETELIVEWTIKNAPENGRLLDLGTGSGAIAISIAAERPDLEIIASDVSEKATQLAARNARSLNVNVEFVVSDMFEKTKGQFNGITANLPYVPINEPVDPETKVEPKVALFSGEDGLDHYRRVVSEIDHHKKHGSFIVTEHQPDQVEQLREIFKSIQTRSEQIGPFTTVFWL